MRWSVFASIFMAAASVLPAQAAGRLRQDSSDRGRLEERFRQRLASVMRERLALNDDQMRKLGEVNRRFEGERRTLLREELDVRREMRRALHPDSTAADAVVEDLLDRSIRVERRRLELFEQEQRELRQFLTPVQRAKYVGMQEQLRRQMDEMRDRRGGPPPERPGAPGLRRPRRPGPAGP
jgi:Spy/CpxP family protein refolding chaperone